MKIRVFGEPKREPYTGFIYIWRNSKTGKSYIGSHMGHTGDGYIGSGSHFYTSTGLHKYDYNTIEVMKFAKKGRNWFNDGEKDYLIFEQEALKYNLKKGRLFKQTGNSCNKHSIWITNGVDEKKIYDSDLIPNGWYLGRSENLCKKMKTKIVSEETKEKIRKANKGLKKSDDLKQKLSISKLGRKWSNNGIESKLTKDSLGPEWVPGRL